MLSLPSLPRGLFFVAVAGSITACAGASYGPSAPSVTGASSRALHSVNQSLGANTSQVSWGIGLSTRAQLKDDATTWTYNYCETKNPCEPIAYGKRSASYSVTHSLNNPSEGFVSVTESGASKIGSASFSDSETASGNQQQGDTIYADNQPSFSWVDVLTATSPTLPSGTLVKLKVTLTVNPTNIQAGCQYDYTMPQLSFATIGTDPNGNSTSIEGQCEGVTPSNPGTFVFRAGSDTGPLGTQDTGTLSVHIGRPVHIDGNGSLFTGACGFPNDMCFGTYTDTLAGTVKVVIKPKGTNFSFTTASGYSYK